jgi:hypothetical protein
MDRNASAIIIEIVRSGLGLYFIYTQDVWFGAGAYLAALKYILGAYFIFSIVVTGWFVIIHRKEDLNLTVA